MVPDNVVITVTRNYGETATEKANELLFHLALATLSIVVLITIAVGWRAGVVVFVVIPTTILLTLFASWLMGYTINRVSLFALIFSIGILVDDAIVVVENIVRHWHARGGRDLVASAVEAVAEVGNPTIVATLTIIVALLPMMFVSGLMGPYMSPIPANASMAMLFSFFVAVIITPWLLYHISRRYFAATAREGAACRGRCDGASISPRRAAIADGATAVRNVLAGGNGGNDRRLRAVRHQGRDGQAAALRQQIRIQVVVDLPQGSTLEDTQRFLTAAADRLKDLPELISIQLYAGTAAPFNFNGLVRHYYLRSDAEQGDLQVNLLPKGDRRRESHAIALDIRQAPRRSGEATGRHCASRRGAAGAAGLGDLACRSLWTRRGDAPRGGNEGA